MVAPSKTGRSSKPVKKTRVRISKSGQVTLPAQIRKKLGVESGEQVDFVEENDGTISVKPVRILSADDIAGKFGPRSGDTDLDEIVRESTRAGVERRLNRG